MSKQSFKVISGSLLSLLALGGCSSSSNNSAQAAGAGNTTPTIFDGTWLRASSENELGNLAEGYNVATLSYTGSTSTRRFLAHNDSACTVTSSGPTPMEIVVNYAIVYPGATTSTAQGAATHLDITTISASSDGVAQTIPASSIDYNLLLVDGNELYRGITDDTIGDGTTAARRPITSI